MGKLSPVRSKSQSSPYTPTSSIHHDTPGAILHYRLGKCALRAQPGPIQGAEEQAIVFLLVLVSLLTQEDNVMLAAGRQVLLPFHLFVSTCVWGGKSSDLFYHTRNVFQGASANLGSWRRCMVKWEHVAQRGCGVCIWRYSKPDWTHSWATRCSWPCFGEVVLGPDDLQKSLSTPTILWFCDQPKTHNNPKPFRQQWNLLSDTFI